MVPLLRSNIVLASIDNITLWVFFFLIALQWRGFILSSARSYSRGYLRVIAMEAYKSLLGRKDPKECRRGWWVDHLLTSGNLEVFIYKMGSISLLPTLWNDCEHQIKYYTWKGFIKHPELGAFSSTTILMLEALDLTLHGEKGLVLDVEALRDT